MLGAYHATVAEAGKPVRRLCRRWPGAEDVLASFGYPQAHEHDAERSVRAGLALIERIGRLESSGGTLASRVDIATGLVVVGDLVGSGDAQGCRRNAQPCRALAGKAPPNTVPACSAVGRLISAALRLAPQPPLPFFWGVSKPV